MQTGENLQKVFSKRRSGTMMTEKLQNRVQLPVWAALRRFADVGLYVDLSTIAQQKKDAEDIVKALDAQSPAFAKENPVVRYSVIWLEFELKDGEKLLPTSLGSENNDASPNQPSFEDGQG
jgi:hypothetical protein